MTTKADIEKARDEIGDIYGVNFKMYPKSFPRDDFNHGFDAGLRYALNLPEVLAMRGVLHEVFEPDDIVITDFDKLLKELGE